MLKLYKRGAIYHMRGTVRGINVRETTGTSDRDRAEEIRARREAQLYDRSIRGERGTRTFGDAVVTYVDEVHPGPSYLRTLLRVTEHFERWPCDKIDQAAIDAYIARHHAKSAPGTRIRAVITPVSAVLHAAARRGWCDKPAFRRPKVPKPTTRALTRDEAARLIEAAALHLRPLIVFLIHTGARLGEALRLEWADVDLERRTATFAETKTGEPRTAPLNADALGAVAGLPNRTGRVFVTPRGCPYYDSGGRGGSPIKRGFDGARRRAGIGPIRVHDLRHTFASWLAQAGVPLHFRAELLGHSGGTMTDRYSHLDVEHLRPAVDKIATRTNSAQADGDAAQLIGRKGVS